MIIIDDNPSAAKPDSWWEEVERRLLPLLGLNCSFCTWGRAESWVSQRGSDGLRMGSFYQACIPCGNDLHAQGGECLDFLPTRKEIQ